MPQQHELITAILGLGVLLLMIVQRRQLRLIPDYRWLFLSYCLILLAWLLTIAEDYWLPVYMNLLEHICYLASAALVAWWTQKFLRREAPQQ